MQASGELDEVEWPLVQRTSSEDLSPPKPAYAHSSSTTPMSPRTLSKLPQPTTRTSDGPTDVPSHPIPFSMDPAGSPQHGRHSTHSTDGRPHERSCLSDLQRQGSLRATPEAGHAPAVHPGAAQQAAQQGQHGSDKDSRPQGVETPVSKAMHSYQPRKKASG